MANKDFDFTRDKREAESVPQQLNPLSRSVNRQNVYIKLLADQMMWKKRKSRAHHPQKLVGR